MPKRGRQKLREDELAMLGTNATKKITPEAMAVIGYSQQSWKMKKVDLSDPEAVRKRVKRYFQFCQDNERLPQPIGLANFLGVSRKTMTEWKAGQFSGLPGEEVVQKALMYLEEVWYEEFMRNKQFSTPYIFIGKNWYGYKDAQDVKIETPSPLGELVDPDELRKRIEADIIIDVDPVEVKDAEPQKGAEE